MFEGGVFVFEGVKVKIHVSVFGGILILIRV